MLTVLQGHHICHDILHLLFFQLSSFLNSMPLLNACSTTGNGEIRFEFQPRVYEYDISVYFSAIL
jgi:hypothetical protein